MQKTKKKKMNEVSLQQKFDHFESLFVLHKSDNAIRIHIEDSECTNNNFFSSSKLKSSQSFNQIHQLSLVLDKSLSQIQFLVKFG